MNILITLPKELIDKILSGEKKYEMRKCLPKNMKIGEDGFFVVEKGTNEVRCWCRVDTVNETYIDQYSVDWYVSRLCVPAEYIERYANGKKVYLWGIGKVNVLQDLERIYTLRDMGFEPYVMVYDKQHAAPFYKSLQRWVNMRAIFHRVKTFEEYDRQLGKE